MSGVTIAGEVLRGHAPLIALVPIERIVAWKLPQGSPVPSIVATRVSRADRVMLDGTTLRSVTERVQLTVRAGNGAAREAVLRAARAACNGRTGTIAGFANVAVMLAGTGPDFMDDAASIFMGSIDLRVSFNEPA